MVKTFRRLLSCLLTLVCFLRLFSPFVLTSKWLLTLDLWDGFRVLGLKIEWLPSAASDIDWRSEECSQGRSEPHFIRAVHRSLRRSLTAFVAEVTTVACAIASNNQ